ncbi:MAG: hypothetical protein BWX64_02744 [Acidobacteria bacterium ADurb.Bin051]|nr:MAG: hypothetical protein BWX64_02744 [Acidobacteria bacterium ADurb.Bin051]
MADPIFDHLEETIRGTATPAEMRGWLTSAGRDNLVLDRVAGWNSDNLKIGAWATELRAAMLEGNGARCELLRALVHARMEHEAAGRWGGIECCGRVYPVWNLAGRLVLYRFGPEGVTVLLPVAPVGAVVPVPDPPPAGPGGPVAAPKPRRRRGLCGWLRRVFGG